MAEEAPFAAAVHALLAAAGAGAAPKEVLLVGAMRLNVKGEDGKFFQVVMTGAAPLTLAGAGVEALDGGVRVNDGVIAALMHTMRSAGQPAACLFTHGYRVPKLTGGGGEGAEGEAAATADRLGHAVAEVLGCTYAVPAEGRRLDAVKLWSHDVTMPKNTDRMYM